MTLLSSLNARFGAAAPVRFRELAGGLIVAEVMNACASAVIGLQGAQVLSWQPVAVAHPVLWLSAETRFAPRVPVRGGVPLCWPWFGPHPTDPRRPAHGFARTEPWQVTSVSPLADGATELNLRLLPTERTRPWWPSGAQVSLRVVVGATLELALCTENAGGHAIAISEALHTYFQIGDIAKVHVAGLEECDYMDKVGGGSTLRRQAGAVRFETETDRVYLHPDAECRLEDTLLQRRLRVLKSGSRSTVVWNPWTDKARRLGDVGENAWRNFVCLESANAPPEVVTIAPGARHVLAAEYRVEACEGNA